jgi:hypothetical protein
VAWATPGAFGATDRDAIVIGSVTGPNATVTIPLNASGVGAVQSWVNGANYGLVISDSAGTDGTDLASSENATLASRPKLSVNYDPPTGGTLSFQDGTLPTTSYAGTTDSTLHQAAPTGNFGNDATCLVDGDDGAGADLSCLIRWDVSQIPTGSAVQAASLTLTIVNPTGNTYNVFALKRSWVELQATWNNATSSVAWATPGALGATDRDAIVIGSVTGPNGTLTIPLNSAGIGAVQSWVNGANYGIVISDSAGTDGTDLASSENATLASRPKLTVTWGSGGGGPVPKTTTNYTELAGDVLNPERGWWKSIDIVNGRNFTSTRTAGRSIAYAKMILPSDVDTLPATLLSNVQLGLNAARSAGIKVILRPYYHETYPTDGTLDPSVTRVVSHVNQLAPLFSSNVDVLMLVQAGFVGPWGEFHSSHLLTSGEWTQVINALLNALPVSRMTQFRTPTRKDSYFPGHGALADAEAFNGTQVARSGHYNDCFLASDTDSGTYPSNAIETWKTFVEQDTRFTPMGGETCPNGLRAACGTAVPEMVRLHWSFIDEGYWANVVDPTTGLWAQPTACRPEITERLGYRFVLEQATYSQAVRPGDLLELTAQLRNEGFANPFNARPLYVVLKGNGVTYAALLAGNDADPRRWVPGQVTTFSRRLGVPSSVVPGTYTLALWLPDAGSAIKTRPEYAIRFLDTGVWEATTGHNLLTTQFSVSTSATPNTGTPDATFVLQ